MSRQVRGAARGGSEDDGAFCCAFLFGSDMTHARTDANGNEGTGGGVLWTVCVDLWALDARSRSPRTAGHQDENKELHLRCSKHDVMSMRRGGLIADDDLSHPPFRPLIVPESK